LTRTVTALRFERRGRVRVELDGESWRTFPAAAVAAAGLGVGISLDRERLRELGRARRRTEALDAAGRALSRRDRSIAELEAQLERRGVRRGDRAEALETMERLGYLDEQRMAVDRAQAMADRGYGDEAIRYDLELRRVGPEAVVAAIEALAPEVERARRLLDAAPSAQKAARSLAARGFGEESLEASTGLGDY
jgi:SOS response regulatory protein OraA/RecX